MDFFLSAVLPIVLALIASAGTAVITSWFSRRKIDAEYHKIKAEGEKLKAEAENIKKAAIEQSTELALRIMQDTLNNTTAALNSRIDQLVSDNAELRTKIEELKIENEGLHNSFEELTANFLKMQLAFIILSNQLRGLRQRPLITLAQLGTMSVQDLRDIAESGQHAVHIQQEKKETQFIVEESENGNKIDGEASDNDHEKV